MRPRSDTLLVWTGSACTYGCAACPIDRTRPDNGVRLADLQVALANVAQTQGRLALLTGGEPFLRADFARLIAIVRAAGCVPGLITTGRPLLYPQVRERIRRAGVAYLRVQLFGHGAAHDAATGVAGGFEQAMQGVRAWLAEDTSGCDVDIALSLRAGSFDSLGADVEAIAAAIASARVHIVIAADPAAAQDPQRIVDLQQSFAGLAAWNDDADRPLLVWEGIPEAGLFTARANIAFIRPSFVGASPRASCLGPVGDIVRARVARRNQEQANSFNFVRSETVVARADDAAQCTAHAAQGDGDPSRQLWLVEDEHAVLYTSDTGDFDAAAIARIKSEWSHLFVDRAAAGVLDDFTEGMRRVLPDPICEPCPQRTGCARRYLAVDGPPFAKEEAWIAGFIRRLRGRVLDVGCGEQLYRGELAPLLKTGDIVYTGIDPDAISLSRARAALRPGRFVLGSIEDFRDDAGIYDHILCLRALNHVVDIDESIGRMAALLRPGGKLLLVETTPFAMLRRAAQVAAADQAPRAGHQHFRNLTSDEILPYARRHALRIVEHHAVGLHATNEWILLLERS